MKYKNPGVQKYKAQLIDAGGGGVFTSFPGNIEELFGVKGRVPVKSTIEGVSYRGSLVNMGTGSHVLIVLKHIREQISKQPGDIVSIELELDTEERKVEVPEVLLKELKKNPDAKDYFEKLSYSHQKEYVNYILEAKKEETRQRRIEKTIEMLKESKKLK